MRPAQLDMRCNDEALVAVLFSRRRRGARGQGILGRRGRNLAPLRAAPRFKVSPALQDSDACLALTLSLCMTIPLSATPALTSTPSELATSRAGQQTQTGKSGGQMARANPKQRELKAEPQFLCRGACHRNPRALDGARATVLRVGVD